ncbi:MAG TPA: hypothetical protein PKV74_08450, partial [Syntrophales bacterium]|nr:hypothetical protein [Syntrophales bacterium]
LLENLLIFSVLFLTINQEIKAMPVRYSRITLIAGANPISRKVYIFQCFSRLPKNAGPGCACPDRSGRGAQADFY